MPRGFFECQAGGGDIFTEKKGNKYRHYCVLNGKRKNGYWKTKKKTHKKQ